MKSFYHKSIQRLLLVSFLVVGWTCSWAQQVKISDEQGNTLYYTISGDTAIFSKVSYASSAVGAGELVIANEVTYNSVTYPVTAIASQACYYDHQLGKVTIGDNVKYIGNYAFSNCYNLVTVTMGGAVVKISDYAFNNCSSVQGVDLSGVKEIGPYAFAHFGGNQISMPDVEVLGKDAFYDCDNLQTVQLSDKLTVIPEECFYYCKSLTTVTGGENLTEIGSSAFANSAITSFDFRDKITTVRRYAFSNCTGLSSISGTSAIVSLEYGVFYNCKCLAGEQEFPAITSLEQYAFYYCNELKGVTFGDNLTSLPTYCFYNCPKLEYVHLSAGMVQVANYPFSGVNNIKNVYFPGTAMPTFSGNLGLPNTTLLYVDKSLRDSYMANNYTKGYRILDYGATYVYAATLTSAGTLRTTVAAAGIDPANLIELSVDGPINGTDIDFLHGNLPALKKLDLSKATIVNGGDSYHRWNVATNGAATKNTSYAYNTENDIVGDYMFYNMPILEKLVLPQNVTRIGKYAVANCPKLAEINPFPATVNLIDEYAFYKNSHNYSCFPAITFGSSLDSIGRYAFYCANIEDLVIPEGIKAISDYSFAYCYNLKSVKLPDGLVAIEDNAFAYNQVLKTVNLPDSLVTLGGHAFYGCQALDSICIPQKLKTVGNYSFYYCIGLRKVVFQEGLETIGSNAFNDCRSLEDFNLPAGLKKFGSHAFYGCSKIQTVTLPDGITELPSRLFSNCTSLRTVNLGKDISVIGESCFAYCDSLQNIDLEQASLTKINSNAFYSCDKLPEVKLSNTITSLGSSVFSACKGLKSINLPTGITVVPNSFVSSCSSLTDVTLHDAVTEIGYSSFDGCSSLVSLALPSALTTIGSQAFRGCTLLEMETLPSTLKILEPYAFDGCKAIRISKLPDGLTSLGYNAFSYSGITSMDLSNLPGLQTLPQSLFNGAGKLKEVRLPSSMTHIDYSAFNGCASLESIDLPESLQVIDSYSFQGCTSLKEVDFPASLVTINNSAFASSGLQNVFVPDNVTKLGSSAFYDCDSLRTARLSKNLSYTDHFDYFMYCDSLESLRIYAGTVPKVYDYYINFRSNCVLEVPKGTEELYLAADYWKEFKRIDGFLTGDKLAAVDYAVLKDLYNALNGAEWTKTWDLSTDDRYPGKWHGVVTEGDHIISINISGNGHRGTIPESVFSLPQLNQLNLSDGEIDMSLNGLLEDTLNTSVLQKLYLQKNRLRGDVTALVSKLPSLTYVDLSQNLLTEVSKPLTNSNLATLYLHDQFFRNGEFVSDNELMPVDTLDLGLDLNLRFNSLQRYYYNNDTYDGVGSYLYNLTVNPYYKDLSSDRVLAMMSKQGEDGDYTATLYKYNTIKVANDSLQYFSAWNANGYQPKPIYIRYVDGDINIDRLIDVADLSLLIQYFTQGSKPSNVLFNASAADGEGNDTLDVRDIVMNVNKILDADEPAESRVMRQYAQTASMDSDLSLCIDEDGRIYLNTELADVSTIQFDLRGCDSDNISVAPGLKGFSMAKRSREDGTVRVVIYSASGRTFNAGMTALLRGVAYGSYITDAVAANTQAERLKVNLDADATGIEDVDVDGESGADIYDLNGRRVQKTGTGVYIINGEKVIKRLPVVQ